MRRLLPIVLVCFLHEITFGQSWTPPENADAQAILYEAQKDTRERRYDVALAKHVWYHEKSKEVVGQGGVRLSFALSSWYDLAKKYPPALEKFKEVREATRARFAEVQNGHIEFQDFHDFSAMNRTLGDEAETAKAFEAIDQHDPESAQKIFHVAQPDLIRGKKYQLCMKYIDGPRDYVRMSKNYQHHLDMMKDARFGASLGDFAQKRFINDTTTLIALLVVNQEVEQAKSLAEKAQLEQGDADFHARLAKEINKALEGTVPIPWP